MKKVLFLLLICFSAKGQRPYLCASDTSIIAHISDSVSYPIPTYELEKFQIGQMAKMGIDMIHRRNRDEKRYELFKENEAILDSVRANKKKHGL